MPQLSRQQRRWAERHPTISSPSATRSNRRLRRASLARRRRGTNIPTADLAWVGGLLEGQSFVGVTRAYQPRRGYAPDIAIVGQPKLLTALRRRIGGEVRNGKWWAYGRRAEAILHAAQDRLVKHERRTAVTLAMIEYQRQQKGLSPAMAAGFISNLVQSDT